VALGRIFPRCKPITVRTGVGCSFGTLDRPYLSNPARGNLGRYNSRVNVHKMELNKKNRYSSYGVLANPFRQSHSPGPPYFLY